MSFTRITEQPSNHRHLEKMSTTDLIKKINQEDQTVAVEIANHLASVERLVDALYEKMSVGGRLFYIGAGTSGRLGVVDASEIPPTYGIPHGVVIGIMSGGDIAIRKSVEHAEDDTHQAWKDMKTYEITDKDFVIGIAASGTTPYVVHGLKDCRDNGIATGCISNNPGAPIAANADYPIEVPVGPEFVTGSTRMKSGTSQKLILNMISTAVMIKLGRVKDNRMVDMQLSNTKLLDRGTKMVMDQTGLDYSEANKLLQQEGSVRGAVDVHLANN